MKFFSKEEIKVLGAILFTIILVSFFNFRVSLRRDRDNQRKNDLGTLQQAIEKFGHDFGGYPPSSPDGKIIACKDENTHFDEEFNSWINVAACQWGKDPLADFADSGYPAYMNPLPIDPQNLKGVSFIYLSTTKNYQLLGFLEGSGEAEYDSQIEARGIKCGTQICNYGRSNSKTPLDKTLEEYENELEQKRK